MGKKGIEGVCDNTGRTHFKKGGIPWNKGKPHYKIRGRNHPLYGTHPISWNKGNIGYRKGISKSEEHKRKIGETNKIALKGRHLSEEHRKNISLSHSGEKSYLWKGGISFEPYPLGWTKTHKEQIRYRDGYTCQICGVPEAECNIKLHVHHIDYDKKNIALENLISLCNVCHSKTNVNRAYWIAFFERKKND